MAHRICSIWWGLCLVYGGMCARPRVPKAQLQASLEAEEKQMADNVMDNGGQALDYREENISLAQLDGFDARTQRLDKQGNILDLEGRKMRHVSSLNKTKKPKDHCESNPSDPCRGNNDELTCDCTACTFDPCCSC